MKILITGANGQLGNEFRFLANQYPAYSFVFTDREELDISCQDTIHAFFKEHQPDLVVNCAAYTAVDKAEEEVSTARLVNANSVQFLVEAAKQTKAWFIHISTDYVYDNGQAFPYVEEDPVAPKSVYARTKLAGEKFVESYEQGIVIRTSWVYSTYGHNFVKTMQRLGAERDSLSVVFDQVGSPTYARDLATTILDIIPRLQPANVGTYNFSNEGVCSWYDFARAIMEHDGLSCTVKAIRSSEYPTKAHRPPFSVMDKSKIKNIFGVSIRHWETALFECLEALKVQNKY